MMTKHVDDSIDTQTNEEKLSSRNKTQSSFIEKVLEPTRVLNKHGLKKGVKNAA